LNHQRFFSSILPVGMAILFVSLSGLGNTTAGAPGRCSVSILESSTGGITLSFDLTDIDIEPTTGGGGTIVRIEGESVGGSPGKPDLPHVSRLIAIPPDCGIDVNWSASRVRRIGSNPPVDVTATSVSGEHIFGEGPASTQQFRKTARLYPDEVVTVGEPVIMRGIRMINIMVNPVQYDFNSEELIIRDRIEVTVSFTNGEAVNPVIAPARSRPSSTATQLVQSLVINPADIRITDHIQRGSYVYVIPDYEGVAETIAPLIEWRLRQGYPTRTIVVEEDENNVDIRNRIVEAYFEWEIPPEVITLVGEATVDNADFTIPTWDVGRAFMWETDYKYVLLEGDDLRSGNGGRANIDPEYRPAGGYC